MLIGLFWVSNARADQGLKETECSDCIEVGKWSFGLSVGLGGRTNPVREGKDIPLILLPQVSYYGERFFLENLDAGFTLLETPTTLLNILITPSYDGVFFNRWDPGNVFFDFNTGVGVGASNSPPVSTEEPGQSVEGEDLEVEVARVKSRRFSYMGGVEVSHDVPLGTLQFSYTREFTGRHSGSEARFAFQHKLSPVVSSTIGFTWKDKALTDYYYGVHQDEVVDDLDQYKPSASFNPFIRMSATIGERKKRWRMSLEYQKLDKEISRSPLVDQNHVLSAFIGKEIRF